MDQLPIFVPEQIRFECTFCGHCCNTWPVPLTDGDMERLVEVTQRPASELPVDALSAFERHESGLAGFTRALLKDSGGRCSFLNGEGLCSLEHTAKPSMCRLFPFTFMHAPEGLLVGVSFASTGVLRNSGKLLSEQPEVVNRMADLFERLNPGLKAVTTMAWNGIEIVAGAGAFYEQFLEMQNELLHGVEAIVKSPLSYPGLTAHLFVSEFFREIALLMPERQRMLERLPPAERLDGYLLECYGQAFYGAGESSMLDEHSLVARMAELMGSARPLETIPTLELEADGTGRLDNLRPRFSFSIEELFGRFLYVRLFSRLYCGPGLSELSFLSGLGHLSLIVSLARLRLVAVSRAEPDAAKHFDLACEVLRLTESKLTSMRYSQAGRDMLELFFIDAARPARLAALTQVI